MNHEDTKGTEGKERTAVVKGVMNEESWKSSEVFFLVFFVPWWFNSGKKASTEVTSRNTLRVQRNDKEL
jgi:hypothetical protein